MFRRCLLLLLVAMSLQACQTTQPEKTAADQQKPVADATKLYNLGTYVSYSEVCAQFRGSGVDNRFILKIKQTFGENKDFSRGYAKFSNYSGYDKITGLNQCDEVRDALIKVHKSLVEAGGQKI